MKMPMEVVKVRWENLLACITCPLCNNLFSDATTISECLHTFCRSCIYHKIMEEEVDCCPRCNIPLGSAPWEKLRADHSLEELRSKLSHSKRVKVKLPESVPSVQLPAKRKERSLSSLVVTSPKVTAAPSGMLRRLKSAARMIHSKPEPISTAKPVKTVHHSVDQLSSPETLAKIVRNRRQKSTSIKSSKKYILTRNTMQNPKPIESRTDSLKLVRELVGSSSTCKIQEAVGQSDSDTPIVHGDDEDKSTPPLPSSVKRRRRLRDVPAKRGPDIFGEGSNIPVQAIMNASSKINMGLGQIWFSLVALDKQEGVSPQLPPLPQISSRYLRVRDRSLPASFIKKYLAKKLDLSSETEVEISLRGEPVIPSLKLHNLVDMWREIATRSEIRKTSSMGSSAEDFVMVLSYGRKARPC